MKGNAILTIAILAAALIAASPVSTPAHSAEAAVSSAERQFSAAVAANDTRAIETITADDWRIIDADGHIIPRSAFLQVIASGALKHSSLSSSDETVRVYENAAIVTARAKSIGNYAGNAFSTDEISTDFWIQTKDGWRCVLTQLTTRKP
jgi:ketosteroid isomerase-like protein